jgi:type I restriction enzyme S subunit
MSFPRYPKYKPSGVEWLGDVPEHWEVRKLKYNLRLLTEKTNRRDHAVALENIESWTGRFSTGRTPVASAPNPAKRTQRHVSKPETC